LVLFEMFLIILIGKQCLLFSFINWLLSVRKHAICIIGLCINNKEKGKEDDVICLTSYIDVSRRSLWVVMSFSDAVGYQCFGGPCHFHRQVNPQNNGLNLHRPENLKSRINIDVCLERIPRLFANSLEGCTLMCMVPSFFLHSWSLMFTLLYLPVGMKMVCDLLFEALSACLWGIWNACQEGLMGTGTEKFF
jgi:hypothetical protein